jgi:glycosyltransferase involved in cell wall biosynthesis
MTQHGLSLLICCYNSAATIENTLLCIKNQNTNIPYEVVLIDNRCTDNTVALALKTWGTGSKAQLKIISEAEPGHMIARQTAIKNAHYNLLSFIDDDNYLPPNWVTYIFGLFEKQPQMGILGVKTHWVGSYTPPHWFLSNQEAFAVGSMYNGAICNVTQHGLVYGAGMSIRSQVFEKLQKAKWQPLLTGRVGQALTSGDDSEICLATRLLGYQIYYSNELSLGHAIGKDRLQWPKLINLTAAFGRADLALLPYQYYYKKSSGSLTIKDRAKANATINIWSKKAALLVLKLKYSWNLIDQERYEIIKTRVQSYIDGFDKQKFATYFSIVAKLIQEKTTEQKS